MGQFRVIDLRSKVIEAEYFVEARSPEEAAAQALGESGIRGGQNRNALICRVYWKQDGLTNMVRLYRRMEEGRPVQN